MDIPTGYQRIEKSERQPAPDARLIGPADPAEVLTVSIRVRRRPDAPALPDPAELATRPAGEKMVLSRQDFAAQYGAAQEDLDRVVAFAQSHGLTVVETSIPRRTVVLSGRWNR